MAQKDNTESFASVLRTSRNYIVRTFPCLKLWGTPLSSLQHLVFCFGRTRGHVKRTYLHGTIEICETMLACSNHRLFEYSPFSFHPKFDQLNNYFWRRATILAGFRLTLYIMKIKYNRILIIETNEETSSNNIEQYLFTY